MRYPRYKQSTKGEGMPVVISIDGESENIDVDRSYIAGKEDYACYNTVENSYDFNVVKRTLDRALKRIPEDYQKILKRFYGIGCKRESIKEIAASCNASEGYIGDKIIRARRKVERILRSIYKDKNIGELLDYEA
jgi:DNA-directed RNA polymerase specialized sigma24 family protein